MNDFRGAICGGAPYILETEPDTLPRWCFGERKRRTGVWELRSTELPDVPSWWEPIWIYRCDGCGKDRRRLGEW